MVDQLAAILAQLASLAMASVAPFAGTGWIAAVLVALMAGASPLLVLWLGGRLLRTADVGLVRALARQRPVLIRLASWTALVLAAVPLVLAGEAHGLPVGLVWYLAWTLVLAIGLGLIWLVLSLAREAQVITAGLTGRTANPYDDLLIELVIRIAGGVLPVAIATGVGYALAAHISGSATWIGLAVVAAVAWSLLQVVAMLDRLLLARLDLASADNLAARRIATQVTVIKKILTLLVIILSLAAVLMQFDGFRQIGASIAASVGLLSMIVGLAAQRTLGNVLAGIQIALTQPIRIDDVVIIEGEWGRIEEITMTYVVVAIWDQRRLIVPISQLIDKPFQNWTRTNAEIMGTVFLHCDYRAPLEALRTELARLVANDPRWDRRVANLQVTDAGERTIQVRALVSSADAGRNWDLRCAVREGLITFLKQSHPEALPRLRIDPQDVDPSPNPLAAPK